MLVVEDLRMTYHTAAGLVPAVRGVRFAVGPGAFAESIRFYTTKVGLTIEFQYQDFYAGIREGNQIFHLKLVDEKDPSIEFVDKGEHFHLYLQTDDAAAAADASKRNGVRLVKDLHETPWGTREFAAKDDQGHTLYFWQSGLKDRPRLSPGAEAELPQVVGDDQAQVGHHQLDDARRRDGQGAALEQPGPAFFSGVLQSDEHSLGAGREIHSSTDTAALAGGDVPVGEVAVLCHFIFAHRQLGAHAGRGVKGADPGGGGANPLGQRPEEDSLL